MGKAQAIAKLEKAGIFISGIDALLLKNIDDKPEREELFVQWMIALESSGLGRIHARVAHKATTATIDGLLPQPPKIGDNWDLDQAQQNTLDRIQKEAEAEVKEENLEVIALTRAGLTQTEAESLLSQFREISIDQRLPQEYLTEMTQKIANATSQEEKTKVYDEIQKDIRRANVYQLRIFEALKKLDQTRAQEPLRQFVKRYYSHAILTKQDEPEVVVKIVEDIVDFYKMHHTVLEAQKFADRYLGGSFSRVERGIKVLEALMLGAKSDKESKVRSAQKLCAIGVACQEAENSKIPDGKKDDYILQSIAENEALMDKVQVQEFLFKQFPEYAQLWGAVAWSQESSNINGQYNPQIIKLLQKKKEGSLSADDCRKALQRLKDAMAEDKSQLYASKLKEYEAPLKFQVKGNSTDLIQTVIPETKVIPESKVTSEQRITGGLLYKDKQKPRPVSKNTWTMNPMHKE